MIGPFATREEAEAAARAATQPQPQPLPRTYLINLKRRPDRLKAALTECQKAGLSPIIWEAVDGHAVPLPDGWPAGPGAYGCQQSHLAVLRQCIQDRVEDVLVLEDDVVFVDGFQEKLAAFMKKLEGLEPWDALFLGGQCIDPSEETDVEGVLKAVNVHRTHTYRIRGEYLPYMYQRWSSEPGHIDHVWGRYQTEWRAFHPSRFLAGQAEGRSDINGRTLAERFWDKKRRPVPAATRARALRAQNAEKKPCGCKGGK